MPEPRPLTVRLRSVASTSPDALAGLLTEAAETIECMLQGDSAHERLLERLDTEAYDYFKRHGNPMPAGSNFGEAVIDMVAEAERLRAEIAELKAKTEASK